MAFDVSSKLGELKNIRAYDDNVEIGILDPENALAQNITFNESTQKYYVSWTPSYAGQHSIFISAEFDDGTSIFSNPFIIDIVEGLAGDQLPLVDLLLPTNGSSVTTASSIRLEANATDADGFVDRVEFYVNGELESSVAYDGSYSQSNFPYGYTWSPDSNGTYFAYAVAVDNSGNRVMSELSEITVVSGSNPPGVDFDYHLESDVGFPMHLVPSDVDLNTILKGNANDGSLNGTEDYQHPAFQGFTWFRYDASYPLEYGLVDGTPLTNDEEGFKLMVGEWNASQGKFVNGVDSYSFNYWAPTGVTLKYFLDRTYSAEILTGEGHPFIFYKGEVEQYSIGETIFFKTDIEDLASTGGSGVVEEVQFFVNGRLEDSLTSDPYEFSWTTEEAGKYEAYVVVFDNEGNQAVSAVKEIIIDEAEEGTITLLYPNENVDHSFAPSGKIPVIADVEYEGLVSRVDVFVGGNQIGSMVQFDGGDNANLYSNRFTSVIEGLPQGEYTLQLDVFGENNQRVSRATTNFTVSQFQGSLPPTVNLNISSDFQSVTSTSVFPLDARVGNTAGALLSVSYYVDGEQLETIGRISGLSNAEQSYTTLLNVDDLKNGEEEGIRSVFALTVDEGGNYVGSDVFTFSFARGSMPPSSEILSGAVGFIITPDDLDLDTNGNGEIIAISLSEPMGEKLLDARIEVSGDGSGASLSSYRIRCNFN